MLSNNQIKYINSLKIKKYRQLHRAFLVEGKKGVGELLNSKFDIQLIVATSAWINENKKYHNKKDYEIIEANDDGLSRISDLTTPNQVLAVVKIPESGSFPSPLKEEPVIALDGINDPGNLGTIIRTADWFGIRKIICSPGTVDLYNPKTIMATMGSFTRVDVFIYDLAEFILNMQNKIPVYGAMLEGEDLDKIQFTKPCIIVIGSESHGISDKVGKLLTRKVRIPAYAGGGERFDKAESLNASIANAIICYELTKQLSK